MSLNISRKKLKQKMEELLSSEEGIILLLSGGMMISDFDNPDEAMEEAIQAFNGNRPYYQKIIQASLTREQK